MLKFVTPSPCIPPEICFADYANTPPTIHVHSQDFGKIEPYFSALLGAPNNAMATKQ
jgi:hypothetical protein